MNLTWIGKGIAIAGIWMAMFHFHIDPSADGWAAPYFCAMIASAVIAEA